MRRNDYFFGLSENVDRIYERLIKDNTDIQNKLSNHLSKRKILYGLMKSEGKTDLFERICKLYDIRHKMVAAAITVKGLTLDEFERELRRINKLIGKGKSFLPKTETVSAAYEEMRESSRVLMNLILTR